MSRHRTAGLTLIETALLVSVLGVVLAVAVPTFVRAVQTSKVAEASSTLQSLYRATASYYATPRTILDAAPAAAVGSVAPTELAPKPRRAFCLPEPAGPTPAKPSMAPVAVDFQADAAPGAKTWRAIGFSAAAPLRYSYSYLPTAAGCSPRGDAQGASFVLRAEGDLDGDGVRSRFERSATTAPAGELRPDPVLHVQDRIE